MGADPNVLSGPEKRSPIHWAARAGHLDVVRLLLQYGAHPNLTSASGKTALVYAMLNDHLDLVDFFQGRTATTAASSPERWNLASIGAGHATQELRLQMVVSDSCTVCDEMETSYWLSVILSLGEDVDLFPSILVRGESIPRSALKIPFEGKDSQTADSATVMWYSGPRMFQVLSVAAKRGIENVKRLLISAGNEGVAMERSLRGPALCDPGQ